MKVKLTKAELFTAALNGVMRQIEIIADGRTLTCGRDPDKGWQQNIEGANAELAFAKFTGLHWEGKGEIGGKDVGPYQVRVTPHADGHLLLQPKDKDDDVFWLLVGRDGDYDIKGWITGIDGKAVAPRTDKANNGRPCYWVPQSALEPAKGRAMSYCRFSTDNWGSDVYVYDAYTGITVIVSRNRYADDAAMPKVPPLGSVPNGEFMRAYRAQQEWIKHAKRVPIGLGRDGDVYDRMSAEQAADLLLELQGLGYRVPKQAIDALRADELTDG